MCIRKAVALHIFYDKFHRVSHATRGFEVRELLRADGSSPFREWMDTLPTAVSARIAARVVRFESGNLGDTKAVGGGVWEARFMFGPGYRLYFWRPRCSSDSPPTGWRQAFATLGHHGCQAQLA